MTTMKSPLDQISYDDLYARWERGNWRATEIDFSEDRRHWQEDLDDVQRRAALWNYAMFFHGEDYVADALSPYIDAAPREEQKFFLATQQVDEARHAVFFGRFMREVVEASDTYAGALDATRGELTWGFRNIFERLERMASELRRDRSRPKLAQALMLYHVIIEGTLAQPGQHFIESYLEDRDIMPGFYAGMRNVSLDEQRHIGFGVKMLSELIAEDPECKDAALELLQDVLRYAVSVFVPPNWDRRYTECFGFTLEQIYGESAESLWTKLRTVGVSEPEIVRLLGVGADLPFEERAERMLTLLRANVIGEKTGPPSKEPHVAAALFDVVKNSIDTGRSPGRPFVIQWDFHDAAPWHVRVENGSTRAEQGLAPDADVTFRSTYEDFVDVAARRSDPRLLMLRGRMRPKGGLRNLMKAQQLLGG